MKLIHQLSSRVAVFSKLSLILGLLFFINSANAADYYWVGGTGNWNELTHWATTSGGSTLHSELPGLDDNVYFDVNSFSADSEEVTISQLVEVNDFFVEGVTFDVTITSTANFEVYGSFKIQDGVTFDWSGSSFTLKAEDAGNEILFSSGALNDGNSGYLYFDGTGEWTVQSDLHLTSITQYEGTVTYEGDTIESTYFSTSSSVAKTVNLLDAIFIIQEWNIQDDASVTLNSSNSTVSASDEFEGGGHSYNKVSLREPSSVFDDGTAFIDANTIDSLELQAGAFLLGTAGVTQTITSDIQFLGTNDDHTGILSETEDSQTTIAGSGITITGDYVEFTDAVYSGTATFNINNAKADNSPGWEYSAIEPSDVGIVYFDKVWADSAYLYLQPGDGVERIVFMRKDDSFPDVTVADNTAYTASTTFGDGDLVGTDTYVVYQGSEDLVKIEGLSADTVFSIALLEVNTNHDGSEIRYNNTTTNFSRSVTTPGPNDIIMQTATTSVADTVNFFDDGGKGKYRADTSYQLVLDADEDNKPVFISFSDVEISSQESIKLYDGADSTGTLLQSISGSSHTYPIETLAPSGVMTVTFSSSDFNTSVFNNDGWTAEVYSYLPAPETIASDDEVISEASDQIDFTFTPGDGDGRVIVAKEGTEAIVFEPTDNIVYTADSEFGNGQNLSNEEYVIAFGDVDTVNLTGLSAKTDYTIKIFEYNQSGLEYSYETGGFTFTIDNRLDAPTTASSGGSLLSFSPDSIQFSINSGNGDARLIIVKEGGSSVSFEPSADVTYSADAEFGAGQDLGNGEFVLAFGNVEDITLTGTTARTDYTIKSFEFNLSGDEVSYMSTGYQFSISNELNAPDENVTDLIVEEVSNDSIQFSFTPGDGDGRLIVAKNSQEDVVFGPEIDTFYTASDTLGQGQDVGNGEYIVGFGDLTGINLKGLSEGQDYSIAIYEYAEKENEITYVSSPFEYVLSNKNRPSIEASNGQLVSKTDNSFTFNIEPGDGEGRLIIVENGNTTISFEPSDNTTYTANTNFGSGEEVVSGEFIVLSGNDSTIEITGITAGDTYTLKVYEFNGSGSSTVYALDSYSFTIDHSLEEPEDLLDEYELSMVSNALAKEEMSIRVSTNTNPFENTDVILFASEELIDSELLKEALVDNLRVNANQEFGQGDELLADVFAVGKAYLTGSYVRNTINVTGLEPETEYYFYAVLMSENEAGVRYGVNGSGSYSDMTLETNSILLGAQDTIISSNTIIYNQYGYSNVDLGYKFETFYPSKTGDKLVFLLGENNFYRDLNVYDGPMDSSNLVRSYTSTVTSPTPVIATNDEGIITIEYGEIGRGNTSNLNIGWKGLIYPIAGTLADEPQLQSSGITIDSVSFTSAHVALTRGDGEGIIAILINDDDVPPVTDGLEFELGDEVQSRGIIRTGYIAYKGTGSEFNLDDLIASKTYTLAIYEYNGSGKEINYSYPTIAVFETESNAPTEYFYNLDFVPYESDSVKIVWEGGNGERTMVIIEEGYIEDIGELLNGYEFEADSNILTSPIYPMGGSNRIKVVYDGTDNECVVYGFGDSRIEDAYILDYNGEGSLRSYKASGQIRVNPIPEAPTVGPDTVIVSNITSTSVRLDWTDIEWWIVDRFIVYVHEADSMVLPLEDGRQPNFPYDFEIENFPLSEGFIGAYTRDSTAIINNLVPGRNYNFSVYALENRNGAIAINRSMYATANASTLGSLEFYWVGGEGSWEDPSHWATTSGGSTSHDTIPHKGATVIIDENSFSDNDIPSIYAFRNNPYSFFTLDARNLNRKVTIQSDSIGVNNYNKTFKIYNNLYAGDSLYMGDRNFEFYGIDSVNYINLTENNSNSNVDIRTYATGKIVMEQLPSRIDYVGFEGQHLVMPESIDTIGIDYWWDNTDYIENIPPITGIYNLNSKHEFPYIQSSYYRLVAYRHPKIEVLDFRGTRLEIGETDTIRIGELISNPEYNLFIESTRPGFEGYIETLEDSLIVERAELIDNHTVGSAVYLARNSNLMDNTEGWIQDGETTPSEPNDVPFPYLSYGDSTSIEVEWDSYRSTNTLVALSRVDAPNEIPFNNEFYSSELDSSLPDSIGLTVVRDVGRALHYSFDNLEPNTAYVVKLYSYNRSSTEVTYTSFSRDFEFVTPDIHDVFLFENGGAVEVNETTLYSQYGIGFPAYVSDFGQITLLPNDSSKKVMFKIQSLAPRSGSLMLYDATSVIDSLLIGEIDLRTLYYEQDPDYDSLYIPTNDEGALTIVYTQSYGSNEVRKGAKFFATTISDQLSAEPDTVDFLNTVNITDQSVDLIWDMEEGASILILASESETINESPIDRVSYSANSHFGSGDVIDGDHFVVYSGTGNEVTITGLFERENYYFHAFTYKISDEEDLNYNDTSVSAMARTSISRPDVLPNFYSVQVTETTSSLNYWNSRFDGSIVLLKEGNEPIAVGPEDNVYYNADANWNADDTELTEGVKVVYNGSELSPSITLYNLDPNTTYQYAIYNYNTEDALYKYNNEALTGEFTTMNTSYEIDNSDLVLSGCLGTSYTFGYSRRGPEVEQERQVIIYQGDTVSHDIKLSILEDTGSEITVMIHSNIAEGTYYIAVVPTEGSFVYYPSEITFGSAPIPTIVRNGYQLIAEEAEDGMWFLNGESLNASGNTLDITTSGVYRVENEFSSCYFVSEDFLVLPEMSFENTTLTACTQPVIEYSVFGDAIIDGDYTLSLAGMDSIYDETIEIDEFQTGPAQIVIMFPESLDLGTYYAYLGSSPVDLATEVFTITIESVIDPEIAVSGLILQSNYETGNQWYKDRTAILGATDNTYEVTADGDYHLEVTVDDCVLETESVSFDITSALESYDQHFSLHPNPTRDVVHIKYEGHLNEKVNIQLMTLEGKILDTSEVVLGDDMDYSISLIDRPSGMYFILITGDGWNVRERLLKE
ncbi:MAG: T9SS type A sorting domain-containing protein [bacterium]|nr:T9SS type A sorting domain-containing protein [bacterium]